MLKFFLAWLHNISRILFVPLLFALLYEVTFLAGVWLEIINDGGWGALGMAVLLMYTVPFVLVVALLNWIFPRKGYADGLTRIFRWFIPLIYTALTVTGLLIIDLLTDCLTKWSHLCEMDDESMGFITLFTVIIVTFPQLARTYVDDAQGIRRIALMLSIIIISLAAIFYWWTSLSYFGM